MEKNKAVQYLHCVFTREWDSENNALIFKQYEHRDITIKDGEIEMSAQVEPSKYSILFTFKTFTNYDFSKKWRDSWLTYAFEKAPPEQRFPKSVKFRYAKTE